MLSGVSSAHVAAEPSPPAKCFQVNDDLQPATCTYTGGRWIVSYDDPAGGGGGGDAGGGFAALFVIVLLAGIAFTVWKVSTARRMARQSGMSEGDATAMTLLTDGGFEATYLASNLRPPPAPTPPAPPAPHAPSEPPAGRERPTVERLRELDDLLAAGAITETEHTAARARILGDL